MDWKTLLELERHVTYANTRALAAEAIGDPYAHAMRLMSIGRRIHINTQKLSAWPKYLRLELVVDSEISILDIQAWIHQTKAPGGAAWKYKWDGQVLL